MNYPVELNFKKIALAQQATLTDAGGNSIAYARQKMFKLKEELEVFEESLNPSVSALSKPTRSLTLAQPTIFSQKTNNPSDPFNARGFTRYGKQPTCLTRPVVASTQPSRKRNLLRRLLTLYSAGSLLLAWFVITFSTHRTF